MITIVPRSPAKSNEYNNPELEPTPRINTYPGSERGRIRRTNSAELLGISKWEFVQLLGQNNIPYFTESSEELVAQVETVQRILGEQR
ncbi:MAG: UPF0175 family protein [Hormoscilla sp. SP12CHS1]|nr:UPF0175 family protein [Hormoscilla sp. SP12CHS1]